MFRFYHRMLARNEKLSYWFKEWIEPIVIAAILALFIRTFFIQAFKIPTGSMRMTLLEGDRILVNKVGYRFQEPERGDVVVFKYPGISFFQLREFESPKQMFSLYTALLETAELDQPEITEPTAYALLDRLNDIFNSTVPFDIFKKSMTIEALPREGQKLVKKIEEKYGVPFLELTAETLKEMNEYSYVKRLKRLILQTKFPDLCPPSEYPKDRKRDFIKRLIGVGGDVVEIKKHDIYINGQMVTDHKVIRENRYYNVSEWEYGAQGLQIHVPQDSYFVLGDNSKSSSDSRNWGFVDKDDMIGEAFLVYWPPKRWKIIK
jgi:signal peptidase I